MSPTNTEGIVDMSNPQLQLEQHISKATHGLFALAFLIRMLGDLAHWRPQTAKRGTTPQRDLMVNARRGGSSGAVTFPLRPFEDITEINQENVFIRQTQRLRKPDMLI